MLSRITRYQAVLRGFAFDTRKRIVMAAANNEGCQMFSGRARLKEQDPLIDWVLTQIREARGDVGERTRGALKKLETHLHDHYYATAVEQQQEQEQEDEEEQEQVRSSEKDVDQNQAPIQQELKGDVDPIHVKMDLTTALEEYHKGTGICDRQFVPPTFREIRHILNVATINAVSTKLRLVTMDADDTIYEDGGVVSMSSPMIGLITRLLHHGVSVALVTAAGYPKQPQRYEERLRGLLDAFQLSLDMGASSDTLNRFLVMGGECNYLHRLVCENDVVRLRAIPGEMWKDGRGVRWNKTAITEFLNKAEQTLRDAAQRLDLDVNIIRKDRAVGLVRKTDQRFSYEVLEEVALTAQDALKDFPVPHCAFNGGNDVWVDVGNKALGIRALQYFLSPHVAPAETLHVGDRFTRTGNDTRARQVASSLWVGNPSETQYFLRLLLQKMDMLKKPDMPIRGITQVPNIDDEVEFERVGSFSDDESNPMASGSEDEEKDKYVRIPRGYYTVSKNKSGGRDWGRWDAAGGVVVGRVRTGNGEKTK